VESFSVSALQSLDYRVVNGGLEVTFASGSKDSAVVSTSSHKRLAGFKSNQVNKFNVKGVYSKAEAVEDQNAGGVIIRCFDGQKVTEEIHIGDYKTSAQIEQSKPSQSLVNI